MPRFLVNVCFFFGCFAYVSCVKDTCRDVVCSNEGLCVDSRCVCLSGYEGAYCDIRWHEKFAGTWYNEELVADSANDITSRSYRVTIKTEDSAGLFVVDSLGGLPAGVICEVSGRYHFKFRTQAYLDSSFYVEGGGGWLDTLTGQVSGSYTYRLGDRRYSSEMKWTRIP